MYRGLINSRSSTRRGPAGKLTTRRIKGLPPSPPPAFYWPLPRRRPGLISILAERRCKNTFTSEGGRQERLTAKVEKSLHFQSDSFHPEAKWEKKEKKKNEFSHFMSYSWRHLCTVTLWRPESRCFNIKLQTHWVWAMIQGHSSTGWELCKTKHVQPLTAKLAG